MNSFKFRFIKNITFLLVFYFTNQVFSQEICSWITNEAYPEELQQYPNAYFYAVIGDNGRCEYGRGPDQETALNECDKWKKTKGIFNTCKPFAIGKQIVWEEVASDVLNQTGCIEGNCENGYGTVVWDDGNKYIGNFKDGSLHGEGELTWAEDGEKWIGTWKNDKLEGKGEIIAWDGSTRVCEFDGYKCAKLIKEVKNFILLNSLWTNNKIMTKKDVSSFKTLKFVEEKEVMEYDKRTSKNKNQYGDGIEMKVFNAFIFNASFEKSQDILIKVNAEFKTQEKAEKQALKWAKMYGQMPYFLKQNVKYIVVHKGNVGWAGGNGQIVIHIHSEKSSFNEELMFHELTHASLDFKWGTGVIDEDEWKTVIGEDKYYISEYAWDLFYEEDLAETALWWFATRCKPSSISKKNYDKIVKHLPNRLNYLDKQNFDFYPVVCE